MPIFIVEVYASRTTQVGPDTQSAGVRAAIAAERPHSNGLCYRGWIFVPDDETCFHLFQSRSAQEVERVGRTAGFEFERILSARIDPSFEQWKGGD
jgi:hypothetical protein